MTHYCLGFLFSPDFSKVVLIQKCGPAWQCGKANGVGGKVNIEAESYHAAMRREAHEELGIDPLTDWKAFAELSGNYEREEFTLVAFAATSNIVHDRKWRSEIILKEEPGSVMPVAWIPALDSPIQNLAWMVFMAQDHLQHGRRFTAEIKYTS